jgi:hypothetical protein
VLRAAQQVVDEGARLISSGGPVVGARIERLGLRLKAERDFTLVDQQRLAL